MAASIEAAEGSSEPPLLSVSLREIEAPCQPRAETDLPLVAKLDAFRLVELAQLGRQILIFQ